MPEQESSTKAAPYESVLLEIVKRLRRDPLFLFGLGAGILLVALGAWGVESARAIVWPLAGFFALVVVIWSYLHARAARAGREFASKIRIGPFTHIDAGRDVNIGATRGAKVPRKLK